MRYKRDNDYIETDLDEIKYLASVRENENLRFRSFLKTKNGAKVDSFVHQLHQSLTEQIDCTACGNCCCKLDLRLHEKDITVLSKLEDSTPKKYIENYCEKDYDGHIFFKSTPCRYLDGKTCSIYENRPTECRDFPYTHKKGFSSRLLNMIGLYEDCPIVFNLMEQLKIKFYFR
jgi:Fe-S-cluster containining protein